MWHHLCFIFYSAVVTIVHQIFWSFSVCLWELLFNHIFFLKWTPLPLSHLFLSSGLICSTELVNICEFWSLSIYPNSTTECTWCLKNELLTNSQQTVTDVGIAVDFSAFRMGNFVLLFLLFIILPPCYLIYKNNIWFYTYCIILSSMSNMLINDLLFDNHLLYDVLK